MRSLQSDWEASSDEEKGKPTPAAAQVAPSKKKGTLKQKLAEKEAERQARIAAGDEQAEYDEDAVLDPRARAQLEKQREIEADLHNATELFGSSVAVKGACYHYQNEIFVAQSSVWYTQARPTRISTRS